jgi:hypothetical protein
MVLSWPLTDLNAWVGFRTSGLEVQIPTQALQSVKGPTNAFY